MVGKLREGIELKGFLNCKYNCSSTTKVKVECSYKSGCRTCCIVYKVTCKNAFQCMWETLKTHSKKNVITFPRCGTKSTSR